MVKSNRVIPSDLEAHEVREILLDDLIKEAIGPRWGEEEELDTPPQSLYLTGMLYPQSYEIKIDEGESHSTSESDEGTGTNSVNQNFTSAQSSIGITCVLKQNSKSIHAKIRYGIYYTQGEKKSQTYKRQQCEEEILIDLTKSKPFTLKDAPWLQLETSTTKDDNFIILSVYLVNKNRSEKRSVKNVAFQTSIELFSDEPIISHYEPPLESDDSNEELLKFLFSNKKNFGYGHSCAVEWNDDDIIENSINKISTTFVPTYEQDKIIPNNPFNESLEKSVDMKELYSVKDGQFEKYTEILSPIVKEYENWIETNLEKELDNQSPKNKPILEQQIREAKESAARISKGIELISTDEKAAKAFRFANRVMALQQYRGEQIEIYRKKGEIFTSGNNEDDINGKWRIFQIAFILMNLESIVNPSIENRKVADLLWFPTGGGKTEAYLGIIAFTIAFRRLIAPKVKTEDGEQMLSTQAYGVTVIMRYTLRLLTIQQFQRAAALMCACEFERRNNTKTWGDLQFNVGLWVGLNTTPNALLGKDNYASAEYTLNQWKNPQKRKNPDYRPKSHNPVQLLSCPWCGNELGPMNYTVKEDEKNLLPAKCRAYCTGKGCFFSRKQIEYNKDSCLPILVVDEDIYKWSPSLLISTIDKFAQIAWNETTSSIFGNNDHFCLKHGFFNSYFDDGHIQNHKNKNWAHWQLQEEMLPPELIVQDELHLIAGPMGTMTALYETAVDYFCKNKNGLYPKIISSTATTRAASEQIKSLFNREKTRIFPPQGKTFGETFYSKIAKDEPGKIFVGLCPSGSSNLTLQGRISAALLRTARHLRENNDQIDSALDPYFTLVSYFNSMRELGGAASSYRDAVPDFMQNYYRRVERRETTKPEEKPVQKTQTQLVGEELKELLADDTQEMQKAEIALFEKPDDKKEKYEWKNKNLNTDELTSRQDSGNIPKVLQQLEIELGNNEPPLDLLLSTNMLSVGVDIQRLGLMMINGQPKHHSEYIQATGRIGRRSPGLIITLYNPLKPRDLSHFENFNYYHSTFFKNVEPISLTPFSKRALDHGLFGVLVGLIRNKAQILSKNRDAKNFKLDIMQIKNAINEIKEVFRTRIDIIDPPEVQSTLDYIDKLFRIWQNYASQALPLVYKTTSFTGKVEKQNHNYLLKSIEQGQQGLQKIPATPLSLREAEQEQQLYYFNGDENVEEEE